MATLDQLSAELDRLAAFDPGPFPVLSLYLDLRPDQHGRDNFEPFVRKELDDRLRTYPAEGAERESLERDAQRIREYLADVDRSANGIALFACSAADLFVPLVLASPLPDNRLFIDSQPHLYPLARVLDDYPRYAVLVADTQSARLFVVAANSMQAVTSIEGEKTRRHKMGGWSQARYQRHVENVHLHHAKEVVDALSRTVHDEGIESIVLAGDEVIIPLLRDQLPKELEERVIDVAKLDIRAPEHEILESAAELVRANDVVSDRERVDSLLGAYRANGLAVVGVKPTLAALELGQVDELLISGSPDVIHVGASVEQSEGAPSPQESTADDIVRKARQTAASVQIIQDSSLLAPVGGVGAFLRFKI